MDAAKKQELERFALQIRIGALEQFKSRGFGHVGGSLSVADLLSVLYKTQMTIDPKDPRKPDRDKLVCSKGHAGPAIYSTLALLGYFPYEVLKTLNQPGTTLPSHCDRNKTPGVDMTTGSLGQGTSLACGMALGDRIKGRKNRVFLIVGDGEADEGQVWEACMFASAKKLSNLVLLLDYNKKQLDGPVKEILDPLDFEAKFKAFGFDTVTIDGNDAAALYDALERTKKGGDKPFAIVLDTIKGKGVEEIENMAANHSVTADTQQWDVWQKGLIAKLENEEGIA
ncbi:MAG: transketolase [Christensenellaceae bacterium]|jgi:transketolase|nr:transketolase [Christensenellaceae bacterium]